MGGFVHEPAVLLDGRGGGFAPCHTYITQGCVRRTELRGMSSLRESHALGLVLRVEGPGTHLAVSARRRPCP